MAITPRTKKLLESYVRKQVRKRLMEFEDFGEPSKTYFLSHVDVEVYEDDYEEGELDHVNSWDDKISKQFDTKEKLIAYIDNNYLHNDSTEKDFEFNPDNDSLSITLSVDEGGYPADESDIKRWEQGMKKLYSAHYTFYLEVFTKTKTDF